MWDHLRRSNIITGPLDGTNPRNPYGGAVGVAYVAIQGLTTNWVGISGVPNDAAQQLDTQYDDGVYNTGSVRASAAYAAGSGTTLNLFFRF